MCVCVRAQRVQLADQDAEHESCPSMFVRIQIVGLVNEILYYILYYVILHYKLCIICYMYTYVYIIYIYIYVYIYIYRRGHSGEVRTRSGMVGPLSWPLLAA